MKLSLILPAGLALAVGLLFSAPNTLQAFAVIGHDLDLGQRDFRIFNNFSGVGANSNQMADSNFPGATGATLAIWKGAVEWGSGLHGDGGGDPTQPGDLGSGGANFDFSYQGEANVVGNLGDNIVSVIPGNSGGTLGYTETNAAGNWRIRLYDGWAWSDGPGTIASASWDLQGSSTLFFGYALGLDRSGIAGGSMDSNISPGDVGKRSLAADDIAGVQSIYGVASPTKPIITAVAVTGNLLTITGQNFASSNSVWFTRDNFIGNGEPVKVTGVIATAGGTEIIVSVPSDAQPGDVLVQDEAGTGGAFLSNAWPYNHDCPDQVTYCTSLPNSTGQHGSITVQGSRVVATNDTYLFGSNLPPMQFGIFLYGQGTQTLPVSNGVLCLLGSQFYRLDIVQTDFIGLVSYPLDLTNLPAGGDISPGETWNFQLWHRENGGQSNFSDAVSYKFCN